MDRRENHSSILLRRRLLGQAPRPSDARVTIQRALTADRRQARSTRRARVGYCSRHCRFCCAAERGPTSIF